MAVFDVSGDFKHKRPEGAVSCSWSMLGSHITSHLEADPELQEQGGKWGQVSSRGCLRLGDHMITPSWDSECAVEIKEDFLLTVF